MPCKVRPFGQPHDYGCLPTCVQAVRCFYNELLTYDEASELCNELSSGGCIWEDSIAQLGLSYEVEELPDIDDQSYLSMLAQKVEHEQTPVICHLGWGHDKSAKHAIVVTSVSETEVEIMNPAIEPNGRIDSMPVAEFLLDGNKWISERFTLSNSRELDGK